MASGQVVVYLDISGKKQVEKGQLIFEYKWESSGGLRQHFHIYEYGIEALFCKHNSKQKEKRNPVKYYAAPSGWTLYRFFNFEKITHILPLKVKSLIFFKGDQYFNTLRILIDRGDGKYWLSDTVFGDTAIEDVMATLEGCFGDRWGDVFNEDRFVLW